MYQLDVKKASAKVTALARMVRFLPFYKKRVLMKAFIMSQFSYCPLIWMFCSRKMNKKINYIHEKVLRLVYNDYTDTFEDLLVNDKSVSIHHYNIQRVAIEMFKVKNNLCPEILQSIFSQKTSHSRSNALFQRPNINTVDNGEESLRWLGPIVWDIMIPGNIKAISDLKEFKQKVKVWTPENCPCKLCKVYVLNLGFVTLYE